MGLRYRKSIKVGKGLRINVSKSGIGYSVGTKGFRKTKMANGKTRNTYSIPGTGISYVEEKGKANSKSKSNLGTTNHSRIEHKHGKAIGIILIILGVILLIMSLLLLLVSPAAIIFSLLSIFEIFIGRKYYKYGNLNNENIDNQSSTAPLEKSDKKYYSFRVAGVTKNNDSENNIQNLIKEYVKEQLEFMDPYDGLKNKDILEDYYDDRVYEISDMFLDKDDVSFVFEPDNPYDPSAIKIVSRYMGHIGYVPRQDNIKVAEIISNNQYNVTAEILGGKYKYVDQDEDKVKIKNDSYGIEIKMSYE